MAIRVWVALWVLVISLFLLSMEGVYMIKYVTRFTEEIFAMLIACVFLFDAVKIIFQVIGLLSTITIYFTCILIVELHH